jgi:hypothetical protein
VPWKAAVPGADPAGYASAIVVNEPGRKQYVQFTGKGIVGVDAKAGQFLWRCDKASKGPANILTTGRLHRSKPLHRPIPKQSATS